MMRRLSNFSDVSVRAALGAVLFFLMLSVPAWAGKITTQNQFVKGEVDDNGRVVWYAFGGSSGQYQLSYSASNSESFLSVLIDGIIYTNNDQIRLDATTKTLGTAQNTRLLSATRNGKDTIRSQWTIGSVTVVQDVYPFEFEKSGQIVLKVWAKNAGNQATSISSQYLLDIDVNNDAAKVLTRYGYSPNWNQYVDPPAPPLASVPWFYMGFQTALPLGASGESSTGYTDNAAEGLTKPYRLTIGDWTILSLLPWGPPQPTPLNQPYGDNAILMEWPTVGVPPKKSDGTPGQAELLRTSYGTGEFEICSGQLLTLSFYPHRLKCQGTDYSPNPFQLESLMFNTTDRTATALNVTLHVTDPLRITGPGTVTNGGHDCTLSPGTLASLGVADLVWDIHSNFVTNCNGDSAASLSLTATTTGLSLPVLNECELPVIVECCEHDTAAPKYGSFTGSVFDSAFVVHDNAATDKGLQDITWVVSSGSSSNFPVSVNPPKPIANCPKTDYAVSVQQVDSTQGGCIDFTFTDCAGNRSYRTICFPAHSVPQHPDDKSPVVTQIAWEHWPTISGKLDSSKACTAQIDSFRVTDVAQFDKGLKSVTLLGSPTNMTLNAPSFAPGTGTAGFAVHAVDSMLDGSITIVVEDVVGHTDTVTIAYCTTPDKTAPLIRSAQTSTYSWHVVVTDTQAWDRGLANVYLSNIVNVNVNPLPTPASVYGQPRFEFDVTIIDPTKDAGLCDSAVDLAGNLSARFGNCLFYKAQSDIMKPNITPTPALSTNPTSIDVVVDDIHPGFEYDTGIDSVWFTNVYNMTLKVGSQTYVDAPGGPHQKFPAIHSLNRGGLHPFDSSVTFTLFVTDTAGIDSLACVTINAVDGRGVRDKDGTNYKSLQWCYPVDLDSYAPLMTGASPDRSHIQIHLTDDRAKDRGLKQVQATSSLNFDPLDGSSSDIVSYNGDTAADLTLTVTQPGESAVASLEALDVFGSKLTSPSDRLKHTSTADLWIYAQNLKMKAARLILQSGDFDVPVYLDSTDAIPLLQKQIGGYQFGFHLDGGDMIQFVQPVTANTMSNGWNVTSTPGGTRSYTISGTAVPAGAVLSAAPGATYAGSSGALPLVILRFHGDSSEYAGMTSIVVDGEPGAEVSYNGGGSQILTGSNSVVSVPKPYGTINGGNIVLKGYCSPVIGASTKPSIIALERATPSPATKGSDPRVISEYTIPEFESGSTHVMIELWNLLGEKMGTLVNEEQPAGRYELQVPTSNLAAGTYILRLQAHGVVLSRRVVIR